MVYTNERAGFGTDCPNVGKLIGNLKFSLLMENQVMGAILFDSADPDDPERRPASRPDALT